MNPLQMAMNELRAAFARATGNRGIGMQTQQPTQYIQPMIQRPDGSWYNPALPGNAPTPPSYPNSRGYPNMEQMPIQVPGSPPGLPNVAPWGEPYPNMEQMPRVIPDGTSPYRVTPGAPFAGRMREQPQYIQPMTQRPDGSWFNPYLPGNSAQPPQYGGRRKGQIDWSKLRR